VVGDRAGDKMWLIVLASGLLTFFTRLSFIWLFSRREIPAVATRALRFVPPAILTAIIFPELLINSGRLVISLENDRMLAGLGAIITAWLTKNIIITLLVGMTLLWILQGLR
jgi:branched-subunit amino acid transport protein